MTGGPIVCGVRALVSGDCMSRTSLLIDQLNSLLRLTQTEQMVAQARRAQAATPQIERELERNAEQAGQRTELLADAVRDLGAVPDLVGIAVGRLGTTMKTAVEQGQDLVEALFGDLRLEHELRDRARFARMLAEQLDATRVTKTLERLENAHTETIDWLMERLGEIAIDAPPALRPTPTQTVVGVGRRVSQLPSRRLAGTVNRSVDAARDARHRAADFVATNVERTRQLVDAAGQIWSAGRDASLKRSEELAIARGDRDAASSIHRARLDRGAVETSELPIRNFDALTASVANDRIERLRDPDDVRAILAYESAHRNRKGVTTTATRRLEALAADLVAAS